jgi:hypothetical protein
MKNNVAWIHDGTFSTSSRREILALNFEGIMLMK